MYPPTTAAQADFIRAGIIRMMPQPAEAPAAIARLEALWDALAEAGYGAAAAPPPVRADLPPAPVRTFTQGPPLGGGTWIGYEQNNPPPRKPPPPAETADSLRADLRHWEKMWTLGPHVSTLMALNGARRKLGLPPLDMDGQIAESESESAP
jgi:hypothetical protein